MGGTPRWHHLGVANRWRNYRGGGQRVQLDADLGVPAGARKPYVSRHGPGGGSESVIAEALADIYEVDQLSRVQAKRAAEERIEAQQAWGIRHIMAGINRMTSSPSANGTPASSAPTAAPATVPGTTDPQSLSTSRGALVNRSPVTNNHYYPSPPVVVEPPAPSWGPWPWVALISALALAAAIWFWSQRPQSAPQKIGSYGLGLDDLKVY